MDHINQFFKRLQFSLEKNNFKRSLKPKQIACMDFLYRGLDVIAVLPTGFGKSLIYQVLPYLIPVKEKSNIVIVVAPLNSIIEDQINTLKARGINVDVLHTESGGSTEIEKLFNKSVRKVDTETSSDNESGEDDTDTVKIKISKQIKEGNVSFIFSHPESLLSKEGRSLLRSEVFQQNVVAVVIDEAHCVEMWGNDFRNDFMDLSALKAFFPDVVTLALTATAPPSAIKKMKVDLAMSKSCQVVMSSPNRKNLFLSIKKRKSQNFGKKSYEDILRPIAMKLKSMREKFPLTIIYMKLRWCGYAYQLFESIIKDQYVGEKCEPKARLFNEFHSPSKKQMKDEIIEEITTEHSRIRVLFATTALGMGVNAPHIHDIIHITPPSNFESYVQEIGRAGRSGAQSYATLYYNNSDIGANKKNVDQSIKDYCVSSDCLRKTLLAYFGWSSEKQLSCCSNCTPKETKDNTYIDLDDAVCRDLINCDLKALTKELEDLTLLTPDESESFYLPFNYKLEMEVVTSIISNVQNISTEGDLLDLYGIWDENYSSKIFSLIEQYVPKF